jgi:hypothetical protein
VPVNTRHSLVLICRIANCKATDGHRMMFCRCLLTYDMPVPKEIVIHLIVFQIAENNANNVSQVVKKPCN